MNLEKCNNNLDNASNLCAKSNKKCTNHVHATWEQLNETMPSRGLDKMPGLGATGHILTAITVSKADETTRQVASEVVIED